MVDREKVIKGLECLSNPYVQDMDERDCENCQYDNACCLLDVTADVLSLLKAQEKKWIPFVKRPLTEEEKRNHPGWCFILDGEVPDDEQEILVYRPWKNKDGYIIEMDRYMNNGDTVYLEGAGDIENGMWWCALPEPPKEETK